MLPGDRPRPDGSLLGRSRVPVPRTQATLRATNTRRQDRRRGGGRTFPTHFSALPRPGAPTRSQVSPWKVLCCCDCAIRPTPGDQPEHQQLGQVGRWSLFDNLHHPVSQNRRQSAIFFSSEFLRSQIPAVSGVREGDEPEAAARGQVPPEGGRHHLQPLSAGDQRSLSKHCSSANILLLNFSRRHSCLERDAPSQSLPAPSCPVQRTRLHRSPRATPTRRRRLARPLLRLLQATRRGATRKYQK